MPQLKKFLHVINENLLFVLSTFLLMFIPLFPKIPLFDVLPGYIVRVRPEDFLVLLTGLVWLRDIRAKRIIWNTSYFWLVCVYACVGAASIFLGLFLLQTIPVGVLHIGKSVLHFMRYLEYFSLFFFFFSAVKTKQQIVFAFIALALTVLGVVGYGVGQKYMQFPVYSTMNREYSKGEKLYLQEGARLQSTFAGHYDLASFLVITLPLLFSLSLGAGSRPFLARAAVFLSLQAVHVFGVGILILTGSATALAGYLLGMCLVLLLHLIRLPTARQRFFWGGIVVLIGVVSLAASWTVLPERVKEKIVGLVYKTDQRNTPTDLIGDGYETKTVQIINPDGSTSTKTIREKSTWSPNALRYGLSMGIRLDTLWPQALSGLARNPLTGAGYGTLAMLDTQKFMEADSTDNNYLRTLGETGVLGTLAFYGITVLLFIDVFKSIRSKDALIAAASIGFAGALAGLFITAFYLDVFAASKVAFTFWALGGLVLKSARLGKNNALFVHFQTLQTHTKKHWPVYAAVVFTFFLLHQDPFMEHTPVRDIDTSPGSVEQLATARCFLRTGRFEVCRTTGDVLRSNISMYATVLTPLLSLSGNTGVFYYLNISIILGSMVLTYTLLRTRLSEKPHLVFLALSAGPLVASLLRLTRAPLTDIQIVGIVFGFPLSAYGVSRLFQRNIVNVFLSTRRGLLICFGVVLLISLAFSDLATRFRNIAANTAYYAVQLANASIPAASKATYLITTLNPYYADLYASNKYTLLPLSRTQPYVNNSKKVWGIADASNLHATYAELLSSGAKVFASDYGTYTTSSYAKDFDSLKQSFDLSYTALGCDEQCNLYAVQPVQPIVSQNPSSVFNGKTLIPSELKPSYTFTILSNRFDPTLADAGIPVGTQAFIGRVALLTQTDSSFMLLTGDALYENEPASAALFAQSIADPAPHPILYVAGNFDLWPKKYYASGFQTFFTGTEYFILMDVGFDSRLTMDQQLQFYTTLLHLEKLPQIKNVFIVSHDLNWQNTNDPNNALHVIEKKLKEFPHLQKYIVTADHNDPLSQEARFSSKKNTKTNTTYASSLAGGSVRDRYIQIQIHEDGSVEIADMRIAP